MNDISNTKECRMCKVTKPKSDFGKYARNKKDGLRNECKPCANSYLASYRHAQKIKHESTIQEQINEIKSSIYNTGEEQIDELKNLNNDLSRLISMREIELRSTIENSAKFMHRSLFNDPYDPDDLDEDPSDKIIISRIIMHVSNTIGRLVYNDPSIALVKYDKRSNGDRQYLIVSDTFNFTREEHDMLVR